MTTLQLVRQCKGVHAGVHIAADVGEEGVLPWAMTLEDPTNPVDLTALGVASQGITVKERVVGYDMETGEPQHLIDPTTGTVVCDMYDMIGATFYPNVWDFVMEYAVAGLHRFVPSKTQVQKLSPLSEYRGIHARGHLENAHELYRYRMPHDQFEICYSLSEEVRKLHTEIPSEWLEYSNETCYSLLYNNLIHSRGELNKETREVVRKLVLVTYSGYAPAKGTEPIWKPAIVIRLPLGNMCYWNIVDDGDEKTRDNSMNMLSRLDESMKTYRIVELKEGNDETSEV